ncbi:MAG: DUF4291 domain-containing protein [Bacteroidales bacterium]|nr:DUF4291 domain-containing protein [Lachnoclostridium sp.]MCM1383512.1 DUF4291 domain-containing protein [Lachnoclostridium sp.]MCM1464205.1 DUF4291 domain-containing protein [Bacteroidales bacterium]
MEKEIRAVYTDNTIRVYQAYNKIIAKEAVEKGTFGSNFKRDRMTWIKPSFLWMMYRCGWAAKDNQECVLAIDMKREAFDYLVKNAVMSTYQEEIHGSYEKWKTLIHNSDIRVQWDPERDIHGNPLNYRSLQLGLRGEAVHKYVEDWIVNITDITDYVLKLKGMISDKKDVSLLLPDEKVYPIT